MELLHRTLCLQPTRHDVLQEDLDVLVPVGATMLVVEAQDVDQLVLDHSLIDAAQSADGHFLLVALAPHEGEAAADVLENRGRVRLHRKRDDTSGQIIAERDNQVPAAVVSLCANITPPH